jgi:DNA repair protein RecO (recombination protein O)
VRDHDPVSVDRDDGIVLRTQKLGEADRIITLLARRTGRVRAVAKGVRRTKSRFGARLEPFTHVDLLLYQGRSLDIITQAETVRPYGEQLVGDYPRYTTGTAMLETAERFTPVEKEPSMRQFLLLVGALRALGEGVHDPRLVLDAYLLRSLAVAGYAPALEECAVCGTRAPRPQWERDLEPEQEPLPGSGAPPPPGDFRAFAVAAGGLLCRSCHAPGAANPSPQTIALMTALMSGDWPHADASERRHQVECSGLVAAYLQWHLEHSIRSLRHVEHA